MRPSLAAFLLLVLSATAATAETGLPVPRFVSLRADEANMRTGPGVRYPVDWVYQRAGLPLKVVGEHDTWRRVQDHEGTRGWMHQSLLSGRRTALVTAGSAVLRADSQPGATPIARFRRGLLVRLQSCPEGTRACLVAAEGYDGWLDRGALWGLLPGESLD